ncbi:TadE/TadG family type IV pilus assembly protein [Bremerella sp. P1]|uniref:TadE/TadG family type IV pilus assembly protein n=1 Tax=Bremerella sp. P1 TaxID=3026424 RepID=UPI00236757C1|nr:TadE family protein [Bremerella sp. P1]WDI40800.1 pilus assembly protein [Bremerella sp. P1]
MVQFRKSKRRAASLLEIIIGLPIVLILLLAVVQFGLLQSNQQTLKMASRAGALVAAELVIDGTETEPDASIVDAINEVLQKGGILSPAESITDIGEVQLNYIVYDFDNEDAIDDVIYFDAGCDPPPTTYPDYYYVQVTICIPATRLTPNVMACFGVDYSGRDAIMTSLYRHELSPVTAIPSP